MQIQGAKVILLPSEIVFNTFSTSNHSYVAVLCVMLSTVFGAVSQSQISQSKLPASSMDRNRGFCPTWNLPHGLVPRNHG